MDEVKILLNNEKLANLMSEHLSKLKQQREQHPKTEVSDTSLLSMPNSSSLRQLQLFAEIHSIKGLYLEKKRFISLTNSLNYKASDENKDDEQKIIDSFELSSKIAIQHSLLIHQYVSSQAAANSINNQVNSGLASATSNFELTTNNSTINSFNNIDDNLDLINPLYEIALQKAPLLYIKKG
jgi:hypothetical protein